MAWKIWKLCVAGMFCAFLVVFAQIVLPLPAGIPLTGQTLGVALCGFFLGWKWGAAVVAVYLLLGAVGLPVFSGFSGGVGWLLGPTGGYLWGFIPLAIACGAQRWPVAFGGLAVCHLMGMVQFAWVTDQSLWYAFLVGSLPYLLKDVLSVLGARWFEKRIPTNFFKIF